MNKIVISMALAVFGTAGVHAQTAGSNSSNTNTTSTGEQHCLAQADEKTWSNLGLNQDQVTRVKEIQMRYKTMNKDRGTENTMRGTSDDKATPKDTDRSMGSTSGTTGTTGTDRTTGTSGTIGTTGTDRTTGTTGTTGTDRSSGTAGTTGTDRGTATGTTGSTGTDTHGTTTTGRDSDQLGYDDTDQEAMERELRTVLTTAQFDRYKEWCQDQDPSRGDSNTDMDR